MTQSRPGTQAAGKQHTVRPRVGARRAVRPPASGTSTANEKCRCQSATPARSAALPAPHRSRRGVLRRSTAPPPCCSSSRTCGRCRRRPKAEVRTRRRASTPRATAPPAGAVKTAGGGGCSARRNRRLPRTAGASTSAPSAQQPHQPHQHHQYRAKRQPVGRGGAPRRARNVHCSGKDSRDTCATPAKPLHRTCAAAGAPLPLSAAESSTSSAAAVAAAAPGLRPLASACSCMISGRL